MVYSPPFYRSLWAFAASALVITFAADLAYWASDDFLWVDMADWLVTAGVVVGFIALIVGIVQTLASRNQPRPPWSFGLLSLVAWAAAALNMMVHTRDGYTSVFPLGLILSAVTALLLALAWLTLRMRRTAPLPAETLA